MCLLRASSLAEASSVKWVSTILSLLTNHIISSRARVSVHAELALLAEHEGLARLLPARSASFAASAREAKPRAGSREIRGVRPRPMLISKG